MTDSLLVARRLDGNSRKQSHVLEYQTCGRSEPMMKISQAKQRAEWGLPISVQSGSYKAFAKHYIGLRWLFRVPRTDMIVACH